MRMKMGLLMVSVMALAACASPDMVKVSKQDLEAVQQRAFQQGVKAQSEARCVGAMLSTEKELTDKEIHEVEALVEPQGKVACILATCSPCKVVDWKTPPKHKAVEKKVEAKK